MISFIHGVRITGILFGLGLGLGVFQYSCKNPMPKQINSSEEVATFTFDTLKKIQIDGIVEQLNQNLRLSGQHFKVPFPEYSPLDTINYWVINGKVERISLLMMRDNLVDWPTFFMHDDNLILVRSRISSTGFMSQWARETMIYLDHENIVYCEDRGKHLGPGEPAGMIRLLDFSPCKRTQSEIEKDYKDIFPEIKEVVDQHSGIPATTK